MSVRSVKEVLSDACVELVKIQTERRAAKANPTPQAVQALYDRISTIGRDMTYIKPDSPETRSTLTAIQTTLDQEYRKFQKLFDKLSGKPAAGQGPFSSAALQRGASSAGPVHLASADEPSPRREVTYRAASLGQPEKPTASKERRFEVWKETVDILNRQGQRYVSGRGLVQLRTQPSVEGTVLYREGRTTRFASSDEAFNPQPQRGPKVPPQLFVIGRDCLYVAEEFVKQGKRVALLNMASAKQPNGGVRENTQAQEEDVSRRTGLVHAIAPKERDGLQTNCYPLQGISGLYSPAVPVFRAGGDRDYAFLERPFNIDVITVAALKRPNGSGALSPAEIASTRKLITLQLQMAADQGVRVLVLSAFGCGAYNNPPAQIAKIYEEELQNFTGMFDAVVFAIIDDKNAMKSGGNGNFLPFAQHFAARGAQVFDGCNKPLSADYFGVAGPSASANPAGRPYAGGGDDDFFDDDIVPARRSAAPSASRPYAGGDDDFSDIDGKDDAGPAAANSAKPAKSGAPSLADKVAILKENARLQKFIAFDRSADSLTSFLGTYYPCNVTMYKGSKTSGELTFKCAEAAFQSDRVKARRKEFVDLDGPRATALGKTIANPEVRENPNTKGKMDQTWFIRNPAHMKEVLLAKFKQNEELRELLFATKDAYIVEHDRDAFWGDGLDGKGQNRLGLLLMEVRGELATNKKYNQKAGKDVKGVVANAPAEYQKSLAGSDLD